MAPALILLVVSLLVTAWALWRGVATRNAPGREAFFWGHGANLWWTLTTTAQVALPTPESKILASQCAWLGIASAPLYWCLCAHAYASGRAREKRSTLIAILAFSTAVTALALTNDLHHGIYTGFSVVHESYGLKVIYHHGWIFWSVVSVLYGGLVGGLFISLRAVRRAPAVHRRQFLGLLFSISIPWMLNALTLSTGFTLFGVDPEPFGFIATGLVLAVMFGGGRLFAVMPVARDLIFEVIPDPVIALDTSGIVLELNPAAQKLPGMVATQVGQPLAGPPELIRGLAAAADQDAASFEVTIAASGRTYETTRRSLLTWGETGNVLLVMRDITERRAAREELLAKSRELQARLEQNVELERRLREEAERDHLTGLYNRRHAQRLIPGLLAGARAGGREVAVVLIDLDYFKRINDRHGHHVGDEVLIAFAHLLATDFAAGECGFRHGGEEFLAVLPGAGKREALARCARWRDLLRATPVSTEANLSVTFSAGVSVLGSDGEDLNGLLRTADVALYRAKISGRDRAIAWGDHLAALPAPGADGQSRPAAIGWG